MRLEFKNKVVVGKNRVEISLFADNSVKTKHDREAITFGFKADMTESYKYLDFDSVIEAHKFVKALQKSLDEIDIAYTSAVTKKPA